MTQRAQPQDLADVLAEFRQRENVTLAWVGDQIGLTRAQIHNIEARRVMASLQTFRDLVRLMALEPAKIGALVLAQENIGGTIQANRTTVWDARTVTGGGRRRKKVRSDG